MFAPQPKTSDVYMDMLAEAGFAEHKEEPSSAEEELVQRARKRRRTIKKVSLPESVRRPLGFDLKQYQSERAMTEMPVPVSIESLVPKMAQMQTDADGVPVCVLARNKITTGVSNPRPDLAPSELATIEGAIESGFPPLDEFESAEHRVRMDPWQQIEFDQRVRALGVGTMYLDQSHKWFTNAQLYEMLRTGQKDLVHLSASFESELLREAGTFVHTNHKTYEFPPCIHGPRCIGMQPQLYFIGQAKPCCYTQMMYPDEYRDFLERHKRPSPRPCLVCCRYLLVDYIVMERAIQLQVDRPDDDKKDTTGDTTAAQAGKQLYYNTYDVPGGYYKEYMLISQPGDVLVESICRLNRLMVPMKHDHFGRRYLDQSHMVWRPASMPTQRMGERVSDFRRGAS